MLTYSNPMDLIALITLLTISILSILLVSED